MTDLIDDEALTPEEEAYLLKDSAPQNDAADPADAPVAEENDQGEDRDAAFRDFLERYKDKSPEEMARIAFQQSNARKEARHEASQAEARIRAYQAHERALLEKTLAQDPGAAARFGCARSQQAELERIAEEHEATHLATQIEAARAMVPDLDDRGEELLRFGVTRMGYSEEQLQQVYDARDLKTLYMAMMFDQLMQAGVVDMRGQLLNGAVGTGSRQPLDPRVSIPAAPRTQSSAGGRGGGHARSLRQQAQDLLNMSDEDFSNISGAELDDMLRALSRAA